MSNPQLGQSGISSNTFSAPRGTFPELSHLVEFLESFDEAVPVEELVGILEQSKFDLAKIKPRLAHNPDSYARNLISSSPHYQLYVMWWMASHKSTIHDHVDSACVYKILEGTATEKLFEITTGTMVRVKEIKELAVDTVGIDNDSFIHQISNEQHGGKDLITMHIYSPPLKMNIYTMDPTQAGPTDS